MLPVQEQVKKGTREEQQIGQNPEEVRPVLGQEKEGQDGEEGAQGSRPQNG